MKEYSDTFSSTFTIQIVTSHATKRNTNRLYIHYQSFALRFYLNPNHTNPPLNIKTITLGTPRQHASAHQASFVVSLFTILIAANSLRAQPIDSLLLIGQTGKALKVCDSLIACQKISPEEKFDALIAGGYAASLIFHSNNTISLPYFFNALQIAKSQEDYQREYQALSMIGFYYARCLHQPALGLQYHEQARKLADLHNDSTLLASALNNLGVIYSENFHDSLALAHFSNALSLNKNQPKRQYAAENNIGAILMRNGDYKKAIAHFLLAQSLMEREGIADNINLSLKNIGECYDLMGDHITAESWAQRCLLRAQQLNDTAFQVYAQTLLAEIALHQRKTAQAHQWATNALSASRSVQSATLLADCYNVLSKIHEQNGNTRKAVSLLRLRNSIHDSLERIEKRLQIQQIREANQQIDALNGSFRSMQQLEQQCKVHFSKSLFIIICSILASGTLILLAKFLFQHRPTGKRITHDDHQESYALAEQPTHEDHPTQENHRDLSEIEMKHREIADYALLVENKNQLLLLAIHEIESHRTDFKIKNRKAMDALLATLRRNIHIEKEWDSFKLHFENVHPEFFRHLLERSPNLTPDDLRFCACLRLNLSSKDIARLLNISPEAVRQRIYRIRKKLSFSSNAELMALLMEM